VSVLRDITDGSEALKGNEGMIIVQAEYPRVCLRRRNCEQGEKDGREVSTKEDGGRVDMLI
jgi:hypothetical protein